MQLQSLAGAAERGLCRFKAHVMLSRAGVCWNRLRHLRAALDPPPSSPPVRSWGRAVRTHESCSSPPSVLRAANYLSIASKGSASRRGMLGNDLKVKMRRFPPLKPWLLFWRQSESSDVFFTLETGFVTEKIFFFLLLILIKKIIGKL